jgi:hypothetical protein
MLGPKNSQLGREFFGTLATRCLAYSCKKGVRDIWLCFCDKWMAGGDSGTLYYGSMRESLPCKIMFLTLSKSNE